MRANGFSLKWVMERVQAPTSLHTLLKVLLILVTHRSYFLPGRLPETPSKWCLPHVNVLLASTVETSFCRSEEVSQ